MPKLAIGDRMPSFALPGPDGAVVRLEDHLGRGPVVVYFYPKDETYGCTIEACTFRDTHDDFLAAQAKVFGISSDSPESHAAFIRHHNLPFTLLSDPDRRTFAAFGVSSLFGVVPGRETFVADANGIIRHHFDSRLFFRKHVQEALEAVRQLKGSAPPTASV